jgi:hypothetical protein
MPGMQFWHVVAPDWEENVAPGHDEQNPDNVYVSSALVVYVPALHNRQDVASVPGVYMPGMQFWHVVAADWEENVAPGHGKQNPDNVYVPALQIASASLNMVQIVIVCRILIIFILVMATKDFQQAAMRCGSREHSGENISN